METLNMEEQIAQALARHQVTGEEPYEIPNSSPLYPPPGRCFQVCLERVGTREAFQVFTGVGIWEMTLAQAVWHLLAEAERYGGVDPFARWNQDNDWYAQELGEETAELLYEYCRAVFFGLLTVLGEDLYRELADLIWND